MHVREPHRLRRLLAEDVEFDDGDLRIARLVDTGTFVEDAALAPYLHALGVLAGSNMLVPVGAEEAL